MSELSEREVNLCNMAEEEYKRITSFLDKWGWLDLVLGVATVLLLVSGMYLIASQRATEGTFAAAGSLLTGAAAVWFTRRLASYRKRQELAWSMMDKYCPKETAQKAMLEILSKLP